MATFKTPSGAVVDDQGNLVTPPPQQQPQPANPATPQPVQPVPAQASQVVTQPTATPVPAPSPQTQLTPLQEVYNARPDLQAVYNPDGTAKNLSDPRIMGIPTLNDWAKQYGVNEDAKLANFNNPTPTVSPISQPSSTTPTITETKPVVTETTKLDPSDYIKQSQDIYNEVYGNLGISALKTQYNDYNKQLLDLRNEKTDKISEINDDPFLTEGVRRGKISKLDEKYQQREANLLGFLQLSQSLYETGLQQAQFLTNAALGLYQDERDYQQQLQTMSIQQAQKQADARFALANGQPFYKYEGADLVYDTRTGKPVNYEDYQRLGGVGKAGAAFADVFEIPKNKTAEQTLVLDLATKYVDAGILPNDSLQTAQKKLQNSQIYRKETNIEGNYEISTDSSGNTVIFDKKTGRIVNQINSDNSQPSLDADALAIRDAFNAIAPRLSKDARASSQQVINQYLNRGDIEGAKQFIISTAISALPTEQQNKAFGRLQAIDALNNIQGLLNEYQNAGGNTNILSGSYEKIIQKLGETSDPKLADIGNRIGLAMIAYRNSVSGAAFTESELKQYEQIFPSIKGSAQLNNTKIQSLLDTFNLNQKSVLNTVLGPNNYEAIIGSNQSADTNSIGGLIQRAKSSGDSRDTIKQDLTQTFGMSEVVAESFLREHYDPKGKGTVGASTTSAKSIAEAIKKVESGGNYQAKGGSGEYGAYQFMPSTWKSWAGKYLGNANAPMTPANQDKVALAHINLERRITDNQERHK